MRVKKRRRMITFVRLMHWAMIFYLLIAALHGIVPAIWRHHVESGDQGGPFRLLLFTVSLLLLAICLPIRERIRFFSHALGAGTHVPPLYQGVWTLRGPPAPLRANG